MCRYILSDKSMIRTLDFAIIHFCLTAFCFTPFSMFFFLSFRIFIFLSSSHFVLTISILCLQSHNLQSAPPISAALRSLAAAQISLLFIGSPSFPFPFPSGRGSGALSRGSTVCIYHSGAVMASVYTTKEARFGLRDLINWASAGHAVI